MGDDAVRFLVLGVGLATARVRPASESSSRPHRFQKIVWLRKRITIKGVT